MDNFSGLDDKWSPAPSRSNGGFTLMELLVVISITVLLAAITLPSLSGLSVSGRLNSAINKLSKTLSLARQTAVSHNTYVWVAFAIPSLPADPPLETLVVASADGTNPFSASWSSSIALPDPRFLIISRREHYKQCQFLDSGAITTQQIPSLPSPAGAALNGLGTGLSFKLNTPNGSLTYNRVVEYTPSGLVYNGPNPVPFVEFGVQSALVPSVTPTKVNVACFRVPYITGRTTLYGP